MTDQLPATMQVVEISRPGGPDVLQPAVRPVPVPRAGEVVIRVHTAGVNRPDCLQRAGSYNPPPGASDLPGLEVSGTIVAIGSLPRLFRRAREAFDGRSSYLATDHARLLQTRARLVAADAGLATAVPGALGSARCLWPT